MCIYIYIYICVNTDKSIYIKNRRLGGESNREIVFVSFVRACERSCVWPRDDVASEAGLRKLEKSCGVVFRVPCPSLRRRKTTPLLGVGLLIDAILS